MPALTLEILQGKLDKLRQQHSEAISTVHAVEGAIQFAEHLLVEISKSDKTKEVTENGHNSTSPRVRERTESIPGHSEHELGKDR